MCMIQGNQPIRGLRRAKASVQWRRTLSALYDAPNQTDIIWLFSTNGNAGYRDGCDNGVLSQPAQSRHRISRGVREKNKACLAFLGLRREMMISDVS